MVPGILLQPGTSTKQLLWSKYQRQQLMVLRQQLAGGYRSQLLSLSLSYSTMESKTPEQVNALLKDRDDLKSYPDLDTLFQGITGMY